MNYQADDDLTCMTKNLSFRDQELLWHPYTQHIDHSPPIPIVRGNGALLYDDQGNTYIDAISSWWVNLHGHAHPYIAEKIYKQALTLEHVIFTGFTHEPAVRLAERLLNVLPNNLSKIFYSDNGSTAVEVAIKMSIQYWQNLGASTKKRKKILAFHNAYHGDTFGAMSVSGRSTFTSAFGEYLFEVIFIETPTDNNLAGLLSTVDKHAEEVCCFIYEPLLQGAGGMNIYEAGPLDVLLKAMKSKGILCIADEVLTGFGRTGKLFASEYMETRPDILCMSKGLTGGTLALGATACTQNIFEAFLSEDRSKTFFHGHSFTANPIACTAALASLDLLEKNECRLQIAGLVEKNKAFVESIMQKSKQEETDGKLFPVHGVRQLGTILAFDLRVDNQGYLNPIGKEITQRAIKNGIYLRTLGNTVYIMPPYCISEQQLAQIYSFLQSLIKV